MECSPGVSFQLPPPVPGSARPVRSGGADFAAKLGLQSDARPLLILKASADQSAQMALYGLCLHAGRHLSQVPHVFQSDTVQVCSTRHVGAESISFADMSVHALVPPVMHPAESVGALSRSTASSGLMIPETESSAVVRERAEYLGSQWPARRWQLLKRPDGLVLLIRDYHLSCEEQADLVAALSARMPVSSLPPERIWLNGWLIWQAESVSTNFYSGGQHGD